MRSLQKFASVHANVHNHFNHERHLIDRHTGDNRTRACALTASLLMATDRCLLPKNTPKASALYRVELDLDH